MRFNIDDKLYDVRFFYKTKRKINERSWQYLSTNRLKDLSLSPDIGADTFCNISLVDPTKQGREKYTDLGKARADQSVKDSFHKQTGRKLAFGRALKKAFPGRKNKKIRASLWEQFRFETESN